MNFCWYGSNFRQKFQAVLEYAFRKRDKNNPLSPSLYKDKGIRDIGHSMSIGNLILDVNIATVSYLIHYESLLQIETILLQNATVTTKCDIIYDMI